MSQEINWFETEWRKLEEKGYNPSVIGDVIQALEAVRADFNFDRTISIQTAKQVNEAIKAAKL